MHPSVENYVRKCDEERCQRSKLERAAPELLEVLKLVEKAFESAGIPTETREYIWEVIRKAEGK